MINPSHRPLPDNTQHSQQTNIHAPGGIQTHNLSRRAAEDLRLRQRGHWDRRPCPMDYRNFCEYCASRCSLFNCPSMVYGRAEQYVALDESMCGLPSPKYFSVLQFNRRNVMGLRNMIMVSLINSRSQWPRGLRRRFRPVAC